MNDVKQEIKVGLFLGLLILIVGFSLSISRAAVTISATSGETLTSAKWNNLVANATISSGAIGVFNLSTCPNGWVAADGANSTPDLRGQFIRGLNNFGSAAGTRSDGKQDPDTRTLAAYQDDSTQKITGSFYAACYWDPVMGSPFYNYSMINAFNDAGRAGGWIGRYNINFDTSAVTKTANETRPINTAFIYCMKQ